MPPSRSNRSRSESPQTRERSSGKSSSESPEILHQLGRAVLAYSMKRMSGQDSTASDSRSDGRHARDTSRRSRSSTGQRERTTERTSSPIRGPGSRSESSDLHHIMTQVAVGLVGFGIREFLRQRKQSKQRAATAGRPRQQDGSGTSRGWPVGRSKGSESSRNRPADPELAAALESLTEQLESTARSIRRLTNNPPCHKSCEVHQRLMANADGIQGQIAGIQTCVNNIKNLHGGLEKRRGDEESAGGQRGGQRGGGEGGGLSGRRVREERGGRRGVDEGRQRPSERMYREDRDGKRK